MSYTLGIVSLLEVEGQAPKVLRLTYESDLCSPLMYNETKAKVDAFLGLKTPDRRSRLPVKQNGEDLSRLVSNWGAPFVKEAARQYESAKCARQTAAWRPGATLAPAAAPKARAPDLLERANAVLKAPAPPPPPSSSSEAADALAEANARRRAVVDLSTECPRRGRRRDLWPHGLFASRPRRRRDVWPYPRRGRGAAATCGHADYPRRGRGVAATCGRTEWPRLLAMRNVRVAAAARPRLVATRNIHVAAAASPRPVFRDGPAQKEIPQALLAGGSFQKQFRDFTAKYHPRGAERGALRREEARHHHSPEGPVETPEERDARVATREAREKWKKSMEARFKVKPKNPGESRVRPLDRRRRMLVDPLLAARRERRKKIVDARGPQPDLDPNGVCIEGREVANKLAGF